MNGIDDSMQLNVREAAPTSTSSAHGSVRPVESRQRVKQQQRQQRKSHASSSTSSAATTSADDRTAAIARELAQPSMTATGPQRSSHGGGAIISSLFTSNPRADVPESVRLDAQNKRDFTPSNGLLRDCSDDAAVVASDNDDSVQPATCELERLGLSSFLVEHLTKKLGVTQPTNIQRATLPVLVPAAESCVRDCIIQAQTGSGKTLAYLLPIFQNLLTLATSPLTRSSLGTVAIVLCPTRELAHQVYDTIDTILSVHYPGSRWIVPGILSGGENKKSEKARLRKGVSVLVATPGRLLDHLKSTVSFDASALRWLVVDEADRFEELGFAATVKSIVGFLAAARQKVALRVTAQQPLLRKLGLVGGVDFQTVLCSATVTEQVKALGGRPLRDPVFLSGTAAADSNASNAKEKVDDGAADGTSTAATANIECIPNQLRQKYMVAPAKLRLVTLATSIKAIFAKHNAAHATQLPSHKGSHAREQNPATTRVTSGPPPKAVVFFSSCDSVDFHHRMFAEARMSTEKDVPLSKAVVGDVEASDSDDDDDDDVDMEEVLAEGQVAEENGDATSAIAKATPPADTHILQLSDDVFVPHSTTILFKLHGKMSHHERIDTFRRFGKCKTPAILLSTDIAARGLDMPDVSHILQYDPPSDPKDYVHRAGRTARLGRQGEAMLWVLPHEVGYLEVLRGLGMVLAEVPVDTCLRQLAGGRDRDAAGTPYRDLATALQHAFERHNLRSADNMRMARSAYSASVRAYATHVASEKSIFKIRKLHLGHVAKAFGLRDAPASIAARSGVSKGERQKMRKDRRLERVMTSANYVPLGKRAMAVSEFDHGTDMRVKKRKQGGEE